MTAVYLLASLRKPADCARQSLGRHDAGMADFFASHHSQFRRQPVLEHEPYDYRPKAVTH